MTPSARPGPDHGFGRVDDEEGAYVLWCTCGWRSSPSFWAAAVGDEWDGHLAETDSAPD